MLTVTDDFAITKAIFTVTRDNASNNTVMLTEYEKASDSRLCFIIQPWSFTIKEGDVQCITHIINLAVQVALTTLKAVPSDQTESYRVEENVARLPTTGLHLAKLRRHIYVFRNRRGWKDALRS